MSLDESRAADTRSKRDRWRQDRQPHEQEWFINAAMFRGNHYVEWNDRLQRMTVPRVPPHRVRLKINRLQAKIRARLSKFLKNRPKPLVLPATSEYQDYLNAKATQRVLEYLWRKLRLEVKLREVMQIAMICGKGFWWLHWNPNLLARVMVPNPLTGMPTYQDLPLGDIEVEVGSPFEILVADPGIPRIGQQPEIMRVRLRDVDDIRARYPDFAEQIQPSAGEESLFTYEDQIASLSPAGQGTMSRSARRSDQVLITEHFIRPCHRYPKGEYRVLAGEVLVRLDEELPYDFQYADNPYPVVEFSDIQVPGQFWATTLCAQLTDLQREYNLLRSKQAEHARMMAFPKLMVAKQHQLPKSSWTSEPGEIIEYVGVPSLPPPTPFIPPNVANDLWRSMDLAMREFDDITQIFPASEGKTAGATSGFQTNLLQEATDSVHGPDIRSMELAVEEAAWKIRRLAKLGYQVPRLISAAGSDYEVEIFEFVNAQIDEMADVVIEAGSALPTMKAARQEGVMNLYKSGMLGDPQDPMVRKNALRLLEVGALDEAFDVNRVDEHQARLENKEFESGRAVGPPRFWENHQIHYAVHTNQLKSPDLRRWPPPQVRALLLHVVMHMRYINPQIALQVATEEGLQELIPLLQPQVPPQGPAPPPQPQAPSPPQEEPQG